MNIEYKYEEQDVNRTDEYSTNPDTDDVRYIFDWDDFISNQKLNDLLIPENYLESTILFLS